MPHGRTQAVYQGILDGGDVPPLPAIGDKLKSDLDRGESRLVLADRVVEEVEPPMIEDEGGAGSEDEVLSDGALERLLEQELDAEIREAGLGEAEDDELFGPPAAPPAAEVFHPEPPIPEGLEPDADEPGPAAGPKAYGGVRVPHLEFSMDIRGDGPAVVKYDTERHILSAHCGIPGHGKLCRLNRSAKPSGKNKESQGRPLGLLLAWLKCGCDYENKASHHRITTPDFIHTEAKLSFDKRSEARAEMQEKDPESYGRVAALERPQRDGEGQEPFVCP